MTHSTKLSSGLAVLAVVLFVVSLLIGPAGLEPIASLKALFADGGRSAVIIVRDVRLPRALLGLTVGASLGISGAALQGFLRNPLAEPGIIGVSGSASLGAVLVFYSGVASLSSFALPAGALAGGAIAVIVLLMIAAGTGSTLTLILAGVALSSLTGALISLVLDLSPNPFASYEIIFWLLGSLQDRSMPDVWIALPLMLAGWGLILMSGPALDGLSFGESTAESLGVHVVHARFLVIAGVALCVGAGTAFTGVIGFVGLVVPHVVRPLTDRMPSSLLVPSGLGGAALLLVADIATRLIPTGHQLNVGVLTALIGAPFFLWLVIRTRQETF